MSAADGLPNLADRYKVVRELDPGAAAQRTLVKHVEKQSAHVAHTLLAPESLSAADQVAMASALSVLRIAHVAAIEEVVRAADSRITFITPYFGHTSGQVTLESLAASRGSRLSPEEIEAAADHILHALDNMHGARIYNGPIVPKQVLVDRQGRVQIEHFGWARTASKGLREARIAREDEIRAEVRSVMELLFRCLTGLDSRTMGVSPGQVVSSLDPLLDEWLANGLKEGAGFESAASARGALPENVRVSIAKPGLIAGAMRTLRGNTSK
ncbi:MAG: hypothetical protein ACREJD_01320 [Phycisphaerales bacterium]